ncbi:MAG: TonB-dependent receptor [Puniceicoccaceae bacterium]
MLTVLPLTLAGEAVAGPVFQLPPFLVDFHESGQLAFGPGDRVLGEIQQPTIPASLGHELESIPGLTMQRRGMGALEPNLRGLNLDRVVTTFNHVYLPLASPTRTASPVNFFGNAFPGTVQVTSAFPSITQGPVPTGGRISLSLDASMGGVDRLEAGAMDNPGGASGSVSSRLIEKDSVSLLANLHAARFGKVESGGPGHVVDEDYQAWGAMGAFSWKQQNEGKLDLAVNFMRQVKVNNPSLPLDTVDTDSLFLTSAYSRALGEGMLEFRLGYAQVDPVLTSKYRTISPAAPLEAVNAVSRARSTSAAAVHKIRLGKKLLLESGLDYSWQNRDATRTRSLKSGLELEDAIWPDVETRHPGAFVELSQLEVEGFRWRVGARAERSRMTAGRMDAPVVGIPGAQGSTLRENFVSFNGPEADRARISDWTGAIQFVGEWVLAPDWTLVAGTGLSTAAPGPGERYRAFLNALGGGVELGNPALNPEDKQSASIALRYDGNRLRLNLESWLASIDDFVVREVIQATPLIYSFRNQDAELKGFETTVQLTPFEEGCLRGLVTEFSYSRTVGKVREGGGGLAEIPPWEGAFSLLWTRRGNSGTVDLSISGRYVGEGINPQPALNPLYADTKAWFLLDLGLGLRIRGWDIGITVHNALDRLAYAYLQPPVATGPIQPSGGTLTAGERIPLPGRAVSVRLAYTY